MADKDTALRLKTAAPGVKLQNLKKSEDNAGPVVEPETQQIIDFLFRLAEGYRQATGQPISMTDVIPIAEKNLFDRSDFLFKDSDFEKV
jgi:hypothetical protein